MKHARDGLDRQSSGSGTADPQLSQAPGSRWRNALRNAVLAPYRLHHYRDVHVRMVRDALCVVECRSRRRC